MEIKRKTAVETEQSSEVRNGEQAGDGWCRACQAPGTILSPAAAATLAVVRTNASCDQGLNATPGYGQEEGSLLHGP